VQLSLAAERGELKTERRRTVDKSLDSSRKKSKEMEAGWSATYRHERLRGFRQVGTAREEV
jgi:hypothetical protein